VYMGKCITIRPSHYEAAPTALLLLDLLPLSSHAHACRAYAQSLVAIVKESAAGKLEFRSIHRLS
jgi:hypothetical protein